MATVNPLRYRGYYYDTETGLYYLQSRYYDPQVKRFINADGYASTGQGFLGYNMFAYCLNCPTTFTDTLGDRPVEVTNLAKETISQRTYSYNRMKQKNITRSVGTSNTTSNSNSAPKNNVTVGMNKSDYTAPSGAVNVSVAITYSRITRTETDYKKDVIGGFLGGEAIDYSTGLFISDIVKLGYKIVRFLGSEIDPKRVPDPGVYDMYTVVLIYDKADEVSGEMIHFYRKTDYLVAYQTDGTQYLWKDDFDYYSCRSCILGG